MGQQNPRRNTNPKKLLRKLRCRKTTWQIHLNQNHIPRFSKMAHNQRRKSLLPHKLSTTPKRRRTIRIRPSKSPEHTTKRSTASPIQSLLHSTRPRPNHGSHLHLYSQRNHVRNTMEPLWRRLAKARHPLHPNPLQLYQRPRKRQIPRRQTSMLPNPRSKTNIQRIPRMVH